jgi:hypothetical protein
VSDGCNGGMKRLVAFVALALVLAPGAAAKRVAAIQVCGAHRCVDVDLTTELHGYPGAGSGSSVPPPAGPFHEVKVSMDGSHWSTIWYVASKQLFAVPDPTGGIRWGPSSQGVDLVVAAAAEDLVPYVPRATSATVGDRAVRGDVSGYLRLFAVGGLPRAVPRLESEFDEVRVRTEPPSPWAHASLWFYPDDGVLAGGPRPVRLPEPIADDLRVGRSIDRASAVSPAFDWPLVSGALLVALALGAAALAPRRPELASFL